MNTDSLPAFYLGTMPIQTPLMLSPMAGFTTLPFRVCMRELGGLSVTTTDLISARSLIELNSKGIRMIAASHRDRPYGVQLFGGKAQELRDAARFLEQLGVDFIDINMGCPVDRITAGGAGAALMQDEELTEELIGEVVSAVKIPVTVKMRLGWDEHSINAHQIAPRLERIGVAAVAVHGRTRQQGYTGNVNLEGIKAVVQSVKSIPVIGNGDVHTPQDAQRMLQQVGCKAVMVGRSALKDPFFFKRTAHFLRTGEELPPTTLEERLNFIRHHFQTAVGLQGEHEACMQFRKAIVGYSEPFDNREHWRVQMQHLESLDQFETMFAELSNALLAQNAN